MADEGEQPGFPGHWAADVVLRDGGTAHLRPITADDAEALQRFHVAQSPESIYLRFFAPMPRLSDRDLERFTQVDHDDRVALVAEVGDRLIGVGRYDRTGPGEAEVAFNIADSEQGRGLGSVLLEHLAAAARERGIHRFEAEVLPQNRKMVQVFRDAGYEVTHAYDDGVISLHFDIDPTERSIAVMAAREHRAEAASLHALLHPASVAVVGASETEGSVGQALLENLLAAGFTGSVYPVNPGAEALAGLGAHTSVTAIGSPIDLAVVAVPADAVADVVADCAAAGVKGLVVVSSGFAETGPAGLELQRELVRTARAQGMRVVGPNSFGMLNTDPEVRLNASLAPEMPVAGGLGLFSQSGALGVAVLASASRRGLGVSSFVSAGNRADVSGNDLMQFWEEDGRTVAVGLYLESVGNPRKFSRVARRLSRRKPVVVVKSGISGFSVPPGHSVRPSMVPREALDAMLRQAGVIRTENIHQLFDVAQLLVHQPLPAGERVAVVGNSDALAALAADAASSWGLDVAPPVTVPPQASAADFSSALRRVFDDESVHSVIASFIPPLGAFDHDVVAALGEVSAGSEKTCAACFVGLREVTHEGMHGTATVPAFPTPEDAARALAAVTRYAQWRRRDPGMPVDPPGCDPAAARAIVDRALAADGASATGGRTSGTVLSEDRVSELLACYGIEVWPALRASDADEAVAAAERLGWPVALKYADRTLRERRDVEGVRLHVNGERELRADVDQMLAAVSDPAVAMGFVVQPMARPGVPVVVKAMEDPLFGPVVSFGLGGDASELLGDMAHRISPLTDVDVSDLVRSVRAAPRLFGYRGTPALDVAALEDILARISRLADDLPEVAELELFPLLVGQAGAYVLAATARLAAPPGRTDAGTRRTLGDT
jgi:acyl-CoA synthetase (NDP forming)/RimJ/RimL family protein N-acetyltransferase